MESHDPPPRVPRDDRRYVLFYEPAEGGVAEKAPALFPAHWARALEFHDRGELLTLGTFGDPQAEGSMAIFATRDAAEAFATSDPFVTGGVVGRWVVREWTDALGALAPRTDGGR